MKNPLSPGAIGAASFIVEEKHLASVIGSGNVTVLATPMMIAGMEMAAVTAIQPFLEEKQTTVGIHVDVSHNAATPPGMEVRFQAKLLEISANGKVLTFHVESQDELGIVGKGTHKRAIIDKEQFEQKAREKRGNAQIPD